MACTHTTKSNKNFSEFFSQLKLSIIIKLQFLKKQL